MAHPTPGPLRTAGTLLRAAAGLVVLLALLAGTPYGLLRLGHSPTELSGGIDLLLQPDDGTLFLVVLTLIGWAAWAAFTASVMVEAVAVARRRSAPRIKGLSGMQSLAGFLLGGIVLLAPTAAATATAAPAAAAITTTHAGEHHTTTAAQHQGPTAPPAPSSSQARETNWPTHTVTSHTESPWDLAEEYLGAGQRWKDIAALNPDIAELATGDAYLPAGAVINLPADKLG